MTIPGFESALASATEALHAVQFYDSEDFLCQRVAEFLAGGIVAGEPLLVIATAEHRRGFADRLEAQGFDAEAVAFEDARTMLSRFTDDGIVDERRFFDVVGAAISTAAGSASRVRAYGEMVDLLWRDGFPDAALRVEELWNELAKSASLSLLCAYPIGHFYKTSDSASFEAVCDRHDHVFPAAETSRDIARLQQRAQALQTEVMHRMELEKTLRDALIAQREAESALRRNQQELQRLYQTAQAANRAKDEFLATLSHELRTPLTAVLGWARLLLMGDLDAATTRVAVETIERSAQTQASLIDDLLDLSRVVTGKLTLERELVDLGSIVQNAAQTQRLAAEAKSIQLDVSIPKERLVIMGDPTRLQQVVWNLVANAIKFSQPQGSIQVTVERHGGLARIRVRDNGRGIDPEFLPHVFEAFRQAEGASTRAFGGLGLGLAIVKYLVESHGGVVTAHSEGRGRGAKFEVALPIVARPDAAEAVNMPEAVDLSGMSILLVDDDADTRELIRAILCRCGAEVRTADCVDNACIALAAEKADVVVTDIAMPRRDGFELLEHIRSQETTRDTPVVALTAFAQKLDRDGFRAYVQKPIDPLQFANVIAGLR